MKIRLILGVLLLIFITSCTKEGPVGPAGAPGANGMNGNANVIGTNTVTDYTGLN
jgi:hypothetical protein